METLAVDALIPGLVTSIMEEPTERLQFLTVADTILRRLTPVFEVNKRWYSCHVNPSISPRFMGMGSLRTWRGHLDGRADFAPVSIIRGSTIEDNSDSESELSAGGKTVCEAKKEFDYRDMDQLVAQAVVSSFISKTRHRDQNSLIPAVGLSLIEGELVVAMYDSNLDILLTSDPVQWLDMEMRRLTGPGIVFLWLVLHHRLFLRGLDDHASKLSKAGLHRIFTDAEALEAYRMLDSHSL